MAQYKCGGSLALPLRPAEQQASLYLLIHCAACCDTSVSVCVRVTIENVTPASPASAPFSCIVPTERSISPTGRSVSPTERSVSPTGRSESPTGRSVFHTDRSVSPTERSVSPTEHSNYTSYRALPAGRSAYPTERSVSPTERSVSHTERSISPTERSVSPIERSVSPTEYVIGPARASQTSSLLERVVYCYTYGQYTGHRFARSRLISLGYHWSLVQRTAGNPLPVITSICGQCRYVTSAHRLEFGRVRLVSH